MNLTDALQFANEVIAAFGHVEQMLHDPMFLARFAVSAGELAAELVGAPDDETRRSLTQVFVLRLKKEFDPEGSLK